VQGDTLSLRLIGDKTAQLEECPAMQDTPLGFPHPCPFPNSVQVLKRDGRIVPTGKFNNSSGNAMVLRSLKTFLPARHLFEMPFGRFRSFALKRGAKPRVQDGCSTTTVNVSGRCALSARKGNKMTTAITYDIALAAAIDAGNNQMKANRRDKWNLDDYNLACRILARLHPECGANPKAGLAHIETDVTTNN